MSRIKDPSRLLREDWRNPTMLAQELYSMFTAGDDIDAEPEDAPEVGGGDKPSGPKLAPRGPSSGADRPGRDGKDGKDGGSSDFRRVRSERARALDPGRRDAGKLAIESASAPRPDSGGVARPPSIPGVAQAPSPMAIPAFSLRGAATDSAPRPSAGTSPFTPAPTAYKEAPPGGNAGPISAPQDPIRDAIEGVYPRIDFRSDLAHIPREMPAQNNGLFAKIVSGSGQDYKIQTYSSGPDGEPDPDESDLTVLNIDEKDTIPPETWVGPVTQNSDGKTYSCLVPVWM